MTFELIGLRPEQRDPALSTMARESVIAAVTTDAPVPGVDGPATNAIALRAALPQVAGLTAAECALLDEWLGRIST